MVPQSAVTASLWLIVMLLQASMAVATPVLVVLVSAGQSKVMSIGQVITGGVVSWTVII